MLGRGKNRDSSPENRAARRPVICARKRVHGVRNAVDHISADVMCNADAKYHTDEARRLLAQEAETYETIKKGKRHLDEASSFVDHVQRLKEGEAGRSEYMALISNERNATHEGANTTTHRKQSVDLGATLPPSALKSSGKERETRVDPFENLATTVESRPGTPSPPEAASLSRAPQPTPRGERRVASFAFPQEDHRDPFRSPAPLDAANFSPVRADQQTRPRLSVAYPSATATQAKVKAARAAEEQANDKAAVEYYGDVGVGLGTISRKKTVPPPKESILHPITGQLLPSARSASANKIFDKSRQMSAAVRDAIARGDFVVPLERRRSSIAVQRVHSSSALLDDSVSHSFANANVGDSSSPSRCLSPHGSFSGYIGSPTRNANRSSATLRFVSSPARNAANGRYALRAAHPSESSNTRYLFGSAAIADRENIPPPRKVSHALDDTTFDKEPTASQTARERRAAYAIEMVSPRYIPTNVSTVELRDIIPTHEELLGRLGERPTSRRGQLTQQYNDTRGFFDPAAPLPVPGVSTARPRASSVSAVDTGVAPRRASSVGSSGSYPQQRFSLMSALEQRSSVYNGNAPPLNCGKRVGGPSAGVSVADTARVLCPDRQPPMQSFRPRIAPSPARARPCQAALIMDEITTPSRRARSVDAPRPTGIRSSFSAFIPPQMPYRPPVVSPTQQSHLWGTLGGGGSAGGTIVSAALERNSTPTGRRHVDSPARRTSICIC